MPTHIIKLDIERFRTLYLCADQSSWSSDPAAAGDFTALSVDERRALASSVGALLPRPAPAPTPRVARTACPPKPNTEPARLTAAPRAYRTPYADN